MEFPPVTNLVSAAFSELSTRGKPGEGGQLEAKAPQPVANTQGIEADGGGVRVSGSDSVGNESVGTVLNARA